MSASNEDREDAKEVLRGHLEECFAHFGEPLVSKASKGTRESIQAQLSVARFCGVQQGAIGRWLRGVNLPVGEQRFKLMCYLDLIGYRVIELEKMPKVLRNIVELISFGVLTSQEATNLLQYSGPPWLFTVLRGVSGISKEKEQRAFDVWKERKDALNEKKQQARELYRSSVLPKAHANLVLAPEPPQPLNKPANSLKDSKAVRAVVSMLEGLLALLEDESFETSEDNLAELQRSAETVLKLSARLSTLSLRLVTSQERKGGG